MEIEAITVEFSPSLRGFNIDPVRQFLQGKKVIRMREHFFVHEGTPCLVFCIYYHSSHNSQGACSDFEDLKEDWKKNLLPKDNEIFELLRRWRNDKARSEGYSRYIVFTNAQLAEIASLRPKTLAALESIPGIGKSKSEKYGRDVIAIVVSYESNEPERRNNNLGLRLFWSSAHRVMPCKSRSLDQVAMPVPGVGQNFIPASATADQTEAELYELVGIPNTRAVFFIGGEDRHGIRAHLYTV